MHSTWAVCKEIFTHIRTKIIMNTFVSGRAQTSGKVLCPPPSAEVGLELSVHILKYETNNDNETARVPVIFLFCRSALVTGRKMHN